ncbi:hypothetical protein CPLU01_09794 [Colletotrichum plurivorum]|uniref:Uncharacterized protein n=1 Tax=Colletotrichum plurivorum TaxID=2175906 RepID=A0A8H6K7N2_9PEZI|nr:hypothetical protein CPLU01_09794 [Colletotrichum plurivorum]
MAGGDGRVVQTVFAVREDKDARQPDFIDQPFRLNIMHHPSTSVLFRLSVSIIDSTSNKSTIYLQISPDFIASLQFSTCDTSNTSGECPPCIERVRQRLGGNRHVTRLQFQLHSDVHAQLVVPTGFTPEDAPDSPMKHPFSSATSLATAPSFSLYFRHNILPMTKLQTLLEAVRQFSNLTAAQLQSYNRMVDLRRLYNGRGGVVFAVEDRDRSPVLDREHDRPVSQATTESCASTVAFENVPRHEDPPPQYEECSRGQQPGASSKVGAVHVTSPSSDCALPEYHDTKPRRNVLNSSKRVLHCGSEDIDLQPPFKRSHSIHSFATVYKTTTPTRNIQGLEEKLQRHLEGLECSESRLMALLEQQHKQIQQLQADVAELRKRNKELEGRHEEVEDTCCDLENRQVETEENIESLLVHTGELDDECEKLGKQMPDICDEVEDWMKDNMGDLMKEYMTRWLEDNLAGTVKGCINDGIAAQIDQVKAKMRKALQD